MARPSPHLRKRPRLRGMKRKPNVTEGAASAALPTFTSCLSCSCFLFVFVFFYIVSHSVDFLKYECLFSLGVKARFFSLGFSEWLAQRGTRLDTQAWKFKSDKCTKYNPPPTLPPIISKGMRREIWRLHELLNTKCSHQMETFQSCHTSDLNRITVILCDWFAHRY